MRFPSTGCGIRAADPVQAKYCRASFDYRCRPSRRPRRLSLSSTRRSRRPGARALGGSSAGKLYWSQIEVSSKPICRGLDGELPCLAPENSPGRAERDLRRRPRRATENPAHQSTRRICPARRATRCCPAGPATTALRGRVLWLGEKVTDSRIACTVRHDDLEIDSSTTA